MRKRPIVLILLSHAVVDSCQNILPVVLPLLRDRFGLSYLQVGLAAALLTISSSLIQPVFGWMSDRWGTQWFLPAGIVWTGMLMGMVGLVPNYWTLLLVLVLTGVGTAAFHPVAAMAAAHAARTSAGWACRFSPSVGIWVSPWGRS